MLARHAVPLTPSIAASLSWPSCGAEHAFSAKISRAGRTNPLPVAIALSPLAATLMDPLASVANKRLMIRLSPLDATLTRNRGGGSPPFRDSSLATAVKFLAFTLLRTLLHFSASAQNSTRFFPIASALFVQKHGGWGMPYILTSLPPYIIASRNGCALPAAMGAAAKRAHRLQERRSCPALNQLSGGGGGGGASGPPSV